MIKRMKLCLENAFRIEFSFSRYSRLISVLLLFTDTSVFISKRFVNIMLFAFCSARLEQMCKCCECSLDLVGCLQCLRELKQLLQRCSIVITVVTKAKEEEEEEQMVTQ